MMRRLQEWWDWWFGGIGRERVEMAQRRIEDLEKVVGGLQKQISMLRSANTTTPAKPAPVKARSWREVQEFVEKGVRDAT